MHESYEVYKPEWDPKVNRSENVIIAHSQMDETPLFEFFQTQLLRESGALELNSCEWAIVVIFYFFYFVKGCWIGW